MHSRLALPLLASVLAVGSVLATGCAGCTSSRPRPVEEGTAVALRTLDFAALDVPASSRPDQAPPPTEIPVSGPWRYLGTTRQGMHKFATRVPIRPRGMFFFRPKPGMRLLDEAGDEVLYDRTDAHDEPTWSHDRKQLIIYQPDRTPPPADDAYRLVYDRATQREEALNLAVSGKSPEDFVWTEIQDDWDARTGLLLPAPGVASWNLEIPAAAELHFTSGLVEPEIRVGDDSDGADLLVEVELEGQVHTMASIPLAIRSFEPQRVNLARFAGQQVTLRIRTDPRTNPLYDYAFLGEPVVASRLEDPVRVVMIFIDTLRPDRMSLYGHDRDTTPRIDAWAEDAAVFEVARSVAPWTLPSARSIITGNHPEEYYDSTTLPARLRERGWATAFIAGNVYLSANFDMHRDWGFHRVGLWPMADVVTDDALAWLDETDGRSGAIQVHYMDPHLPYQEPQRYRRLYAEDPPAGMREEFHLREVRRTPAFKSEEGHRYIKDRYDQNVRYTTDQVARILDRLDDNDIVLLYSDHGEEFWEHGGFEHGHTVFEELLRVPMVVKAPGITPGRFDAPVSVLDITPTILDLLDRPDASLDGDSLVPLAAGDPAAEEHFRGRTHAFGRPLYGTDRWGVVYQGEKWSTQGGREALYDLERDPGEQTNLLLKDDGDNGAAYRVYLGEALSTDVPVSYRFAPTRAADTPVHENWGLCTIPGGFKEVYLGGDPLNNGAATVRKISGDDARSTVESLLSAYQIASHPLPADLGDAVELCWHPGQGGEREIYVVPERPMDEVGRQLTCSIYQGDSQSGKRITFGIDPVRPTLLSRRRTPLQKARLPQRTILMTHGIAPVFDADAHISATDPEANDMLEAIGYVVPDDAQATVPTEGSPCVPPTTQLPAPPE